MTTALVCRFLAPPLRSERLAGHLVVLRVDNIPWNDWGTQRAIERTFRRLKQRPSWRAGTLASAAA